MDRTLLHLESPGGRGSGISDTKEMKHEKLITSQRADRKTQAGRLTSDACSESRKTKQTKELVASFCLLFTNRQQRALLTGS